MSFGRIAGRRLALVLALTLSLGGCMQFEYGMVLEEDLSGTANLDFTVDMDRTAYAMAMVQKMFMGGEGAPTEEEVAAARAELMKDIDEEGFDEAEMREEIENDLPEGMELLSASQSWDDAKMNIKLDLGFDNVSRLNELTISGDEEDEIPVSDQKPFGDLQILDEGNTLTIRNEPINPLSETEEAAQMMPAIEGVLATAFADLGIVFKITAPFEVIEHNATRQEGNTLYWEYGFDALKQGTEGILVRYRK